MSTEATLPFINETPQESLSTLQNWLDGLWQWGLAFLPKLLVAAAIFFLGWWLSKAITRLIRKISYKCSFVI